MNRLRSGLAFLAVLGLAACATLPHATALDAQVAAERWPGTTVELLEAGRVAYVSRCAGCHNLHLPHEKLPEEWPGTVAEMEKDAHLKPGERALIEHYLVLMSSRAHAPTGGAAAAR